MRLLYDQNLNLYNIYWLIFIYLITCICVFPVARKCFAQLETSDTQAWNAVSLFCLFVCFGSFQLIPECFTHIETSPFLNFFHKVYENISNFIVISVNQFWSIHDTYGHRAVRVQLLWHGTSMYNSDLRWPFSIRYWLVGLKCRNVYCCLTCLINVTIVYIIDHCLIH